MAHSARVWNYFLGGKDYFPADQQAAEMALELMPSLVEAARADRGFLARAVRYLAGEAGIRQFLDIGTGLPTANNTHQVAQAVAPESRIVYVDNDPLVLVHARALLTSSPQGATSYIEADLRDPDKILQGAAATLDFDQPIALMLLGIVNFIVDDQQAHAIVERLVDALPAGSYLAMTHPPRKSTARRPQRSRGSGTRAAPRRSVPAAARSWPASSTVWNCWSPGVVSSSQWRPDPANGNPVEVAEYCAVGRKP